jgi:hypothetical protein
MIWRALPIIHEIFRELVEAGLRRAVAQAAHSPRRFPPCIFLMLDRYLLNQLTGFSVIGHLTPYTAFRIGGSDMDYWTLRLLLC